MSGIFVRPSLSPLLHPTTNGVINRTGIYGHAYYYAFLLAIVLCWSPSKLLAYLAPWIGIGLFLVITRSRQTVFRLLLLLFLWVAMLPLYALLTPGFVWHSAILALLTYGSFIFLFVIPTKPLADRGLLERMLAVARRVLLFEASWGIVQGVLAAIRNGTFDGATGDAVAGTIRPISVYRDFSNPMFAVNIALLLLCLMPQLSYKGKGRLAFVVGLVALVLASVIHVLLFAALSFLFAIVVYYPSFFLRKTGWLILSLLVTVSMFASLLLSHNFSTIRSFVAYTVEGRTPRAQVINRVLTDMPSEYPWMPIIGIGPGQFGSRAGLIGTGMYFGSPSNPRDISLLPKGMSSAFRDYILDLWLTMSLNPTTNDTSSTYKPFLSWLSMYVEFGAVAMLVAVGVTGRIMWKLRRRMYRQPADRLQAALLSAGILFVLLLGAQENYWETTQAILIGLFLMKVHYANLVYVTSVTTNKPVIVGT